MITVKAAGVPDLSMGRIPWPKRPVSGGHADRQDRRYGPDPTVPVKWIDLPARPEGRQV
jgi:hypothetical protein